MKKKKKKISPSLKLSLRQPWVWSVSDPIFLATAYEGGWPVLSLTVLSSYWQSAVSVLIIAELARGCRWSINLGPNFCPGRGLNPKLSGWQSSTLTNRLPRNPFPSRMVDWIVPLSQVGGIGKIRCLAVRLDSTPVISFDHPFLLY